MVAEWLKDLAETYDTVGKTRSFDASIGETALISGGDYDWAMDVVKETEADHRRKSWKSSNKRTGIQTDCSPTKV